MKRIPLSEHYLFVLKKYFSHKYRKIAKIHCKPWGLYFSKALFEGLIFGRAYLRREICVSKPIGLAL